MNKRPPPQPRSVMQAFRRELPHLFLLLAVFFGLQVLPGLWAGPEVVLSSALSSLFMLAGYGLTRRV